MHRLSLRNIVIATIVLFIIFLIGNSIRVSLYSPAPEDQAAQVGQTFPLNPKPSQPPGGKPPVYGPADTTPAPRSPNEKSDPGSITVGGVTVQPTWSGGPALKFKWKF